MRSLLKRDMDGKPFEVYSCEGIVTAFRLQHCDFDELASLFTVYMADGEEANWDACLAALPRDLAGQYLAYLESDVVACDYKPYPGIFLFGGDSDEYIEEVKNRMRPKYVALVAFVHDRYGE